MRIVVDGELGEFVDPELLAEELGKFYARQVLAGRLKLGGSLDMQ